MASAATSTNGRDIVGTTSVGDSPKILVDGAKTFRLTFRNFNGMIHARGECCSPPPFNAYGYLWKFHLFPKGYHHDNDTEYVSCHMECMEDDKDAPAPSAQMTFRCKEYEKPFPTYVYRINRMPGLSNYLKREDVLENYLEEDGSLIIKVDVRITVDSKRVTSSSSSNSAIPPVASMSIFVRWCWEDLVSFVSVIVAGLRRIKFCPDPPPLVTMAYEWMTRGCRQIYILLKILNRKMARPSLIASYKWATVTEESTSSSSNSTSPPRAPMSSSSASMPMVARFTGVDILLLILIGIGIKIMMFFGFLILDLFDTFIITIYPDSFIFNPNAIGIIIGILIIDIGIGIEFIRQKNIHVTGKDISTLFAIEIIIIIFFVRPDPIWINIGNYILNIDIGIRFMRWKNIHVTDKTIFILFGIVISIISFVRLNPVWGDINMVICTCIAAMGSQISESSQHNDTMKQKIASLQNNLETMKVENHASRQEISNLKAQHSKEIDDQIVLREKACDDAREEEIEMAHKQLDERNEYYKTIKKELDNELKQLREKQKEDRLRIVISGPGGAPVYYKTSILKGKTYNSPDGRTLYMVPIFDGDVFGYTFPNFMGTVTRGEIRLGGIVVCKLSDTTFSTQATENASGFVGDRDHTRQMRTVGFDNGRGIVAVVAGTVGPILFNDYVNTLPQNLELPQLVEFLTRHRADNNDDAVLLQNLTLNAVIFDKSRIDGILSLCEEGDDSL